MLSVMVHGLAVAALAWQAARPPEGSVPQSPSRIATLWLLPAPAHPSPALMAAPTMTPAARDALAVRRAAVPPRVAPSPTRRVMPSRAAPAPDSAVQGIAFAVPALRIAPDRTPGAGAPAPAATPGPLAPPAAPPAWLMQAAQQAALAQIGQRLQQHLAALAPPEVAGDGRCLLADDDPSALRCDTPALQASVAADAPALASLLRAYRGMAPHIDHVALTYAQQRFRLDAR